MFFTGGKDRMLKQWDADTFDHILTLKVACENRITIICMIKYYHVPKYFV